MKVATIVALVLAAATSFPSSTASAQPREERGGRVPYDRRLEPPPPPPQTREWVRLATPTPTKYGTEWIVLGEKAGMYRMLRIEAISGVVHLRRVRVDFANGRTTTFNVDQWLNLRRPNARIDLGALRSVEKIVVTTARSPAGTYVVYGTSRTPTGELVAAR
jgi:hypothetical protein